MFLIVFRFRDRASVLIRDPEGIVGDIVSIDQFDADRFGIGACFKGLFPFQPLMEGLVVVDPLESVNERIGSGIVDLRIELQYLLFEHGGDEKLVIRSPERIELVMRFVRPSDLLEGVDERLFDGYVF